MKLVRYADHFLVHGAPADAEPLFGEVAAVLEPVGLRLSEEKTQLTHIDDGFDFLGWRIQRRTLARTWRRQENGLHLSIEALAGFDQGQDQTPDPPSSPPHARRPPAPPQPDDQGLVQLLPARVSKRTFSYVDHFAFWRIVGWLKKRHPKLNTHTVVRRHRGASDC
ncbi:MAG: group II intron maturase-specific domain-containing protein [Nocardioides sp.]